jgi:ribose transport system ATP-binding protein
MMKNLCDRGMGVVYISHHLRDILDVSDYVTVLRNGSVVARDITTIGLDVKELVGLMVGEAGVEHPAGRAGVDPSMSEHRGDEGIRCSEVTSSRLAGIKFTVNTGEVLGIYGVDGSGREDIGNCLVGELGSACIEKNGELPSLRRRDRTSQRPVVRMLARDRLSRAAISQLSVRENLTLPLVGALAWHGFLSKQQERRAALEILATVSLHLPDVDDSFITLSGGMQQRALLGRALAGGPDLLILDEPTQGVDVVSRVRIHDLIRGECVRRGLAVLVITSDEEEAVTVCDRVLVVNRGRIVEEFLGQDAHVRDIREAAELTVME